MNSIFRIQQEYLDLINIIEENEGELTPELEEQLAINIDDFEAKMDSYSNVIALLTGEIATIKVETDRLSKLSNTKSNLVNRLKTNMRDALMLYGDDGKSGNKTLDIGTHKFYTRKNEKLYIPDEDKFLSFNREYVDVIVKEKINKDEFKMFKSLLKHTREDEELEVKYNYTIDKRKLKADLKNKVEVEGVNLIRDDNIIIK